MKVKEEVKRLLAVEKNSVAISKRFLESLRREHQILYRVAYRTTGVPSIHVSAVSYGDDVMHVDKWEYIEFLKDLGKLRYLASRQKASRA